MSLKNTQKIKCPDCGTEGEFTIWQSINTKLNPTGEGGAFVWQVICVYLPEMQESPLC